MKTTKKLAHRAGIMLIAFCIAVRLFITVLVAAELIKTGYSVRRFDSMETEMTDDGQMRLIYHGTGSAGTRCRYKLTVNDVIAETEKYDISYLGRKKIGWDFKAVAPGETLLLVDKMGGGHYIAGQNSDIYKVTVHDDMTITYEVRSTTIFNFSGNEPDYEVYTFESAEFTSGSNSFTTGFLDVNDMFDYCYGEVVNLTEDSGSYLSPDSEELNRMDKLEIHEWLCPEDTMIDLDEPYLITDIVYFDKDNHRMYVQHDNYFGAYWYVQELEPEISIEYLESRLHEGGE